MEQIKLEKPTRWDMAASNPKALKDKAMEEVRRVEGILRRWDPINVQPGVMAPSDE
jgi:hypothetical protein